MSQVTGLHHVTCIAGDAQDNVDFYSGVLGIQPSADSPTGLTSGDGLAGRDGY